MSKRIPKWILRKITRRKAYPSKSPFGGKVWRLTLECGHIAMRAGGADGGISKRVHCGVCAELKQDLQSGEKPSKLRISE